MDAPIFLIGIHDPEKKQLFVPGAIEKSVKQPLYSYDLRDKSRPAVWCFDNQKELVLNDFSKDFGKYFPGIPVPPPVSGETPESLIYFPLSTNNKKIGVISFQSFKKNTYSEYQIDIIRTLAIYVSTALENARLYANMEAEVKERTVEIVKQKEELAKLSIVASETDNAIIIADADANIEWVNASYTRLTGYSLEDLKAVNKTNIMSVSGNPRIKEILDDCVRKSKSAVYEVMNKTKDGREIWVQTTLTPVSGSNGKVMNLVAIDSDITELKRVETEIKKQHSIISEKNKHITDSINYAKRIQDAILPPYEAVRSMLPDSFVLYRPKDIVSGDFYWMTEKAGKLFFAVVDCTGHGVPGAFVSIIGHNGLFRSVNEFGLTKPSEILDKLNDLVEETFGQSNKTQINDGMDIALCSYDRKTNELEFSGANNPLYIISNGEFTEVKGDKQPIGAFDHRKKFTNHSFKLKKDDAVYVFSDGYADQFGGVLQKKFKYNQFKNILVGLNGTAMSEQKDILNTTITNWMGDLEQVDDICVIGVKI
jgi:PAS domain S-box-containing protein